jgi:hypothetical protein
MPGLKYGLRQVKMACARIRTHGYRGHNPLHTVYKTRKGLKFSKYFGEGQKLTQKLTSQALPIFEDEHCFLTKSIFAFLSTIHFQK